MYNYYKAKLRNRRRKKVLLALLSILIIVLLCFYYKSFVVKNVTEYSKKQIETNVVASINNAVLFSLNNPVNYNDLIIVQKDNDGNITLLASDSYKINKINKDVVSIAKTFIDNDCKKGVDLPFGTLTGVTIFSGYGKNVNLKILSVGKVNSNFTSEFITAGINQTRHSVYLEITAEVFINLPFIAKSFTEKTQILICDAVLVGKVPSVYLGNSIF